MRCSAAMRVIQRSDIKDICVERGALCAERWRECGEGRCPQASHQGHGTTFPRESAPFLCAPRATLNAPRAVDTASRTQITFPHLVKDFTKSGDYGTRVRAGSAASRVRGIQCGIDAGCVRADAARAADAGEAGG